MTAPVATLVTPSVGSKLRRNQALTVDVTGADLSTYVLLALFPDVQRAELVFDSAAPDLGLNYDVTRTAITDGYRHVISRVGGWFHRPVLRVRSVEAYSLTLVSPNGGSTYRTGVEQTISWSHTGTYTSFDLEVSYNNGSSWSSIVTDLDGADTSYAWTPGATESTSCLVRVTGHPAVGSDLIDVSDAVFALETYAIAITAPNGGETINTSSSTSITWTSDGTYTSFDLEYSTNSGSSWTSIATGVTSPYSWSTPASESTTVRVRVTGNTSHGFTLQDASDADFELANLSPPAVVTGSGDQLWAESSTATDDGGSPTETIVTQPDSKGGASLTVNVPGFTRSAGTNPYSSTGSTARLSRTAGSTIKTAVNNGDHSFVMRCVAGGTGVSSNSGSPYFAYNGVEFIANATSMTMKRLIPSSTFTNVYSWTKTYTALSAGLHTFGISSDRISSSDRTVTFYIDGVSIGTVSANPRDTTLAASAIQQIGATYTAVSVVNLAAVLHFSTLLSGTDHADIHTYLANVYP